MQKEEVKYLAELIRILEETELKLEKAFIDKNQIYLKKTKEFILQIYQKIKEVLNE